MWYVYKNGFTLSQFVDFSSNIWYCVENTVLEEEWGMDILFYNACIVDIDEGIKERERNEDLKKYITFLIKSLRNHRNATLYNVARDTTEVIGICKESIALSNSNIKMLDKNCGIIAERFRDKEHEAQKRVERLAIKIKTGCMLQAIIKHDDNTSYLISKIDSVQYLEESLLELNRGIEVNDKKLGKSCLVTFDENHGVQEIKVLLDNSAKYFSSEFLELKPVYTDEHNTKKMIHSVLKVVRDELKHDYHNALVLRNTILHYARSNDLINYDDMVNELVIKYLKETNQNENLISKVESKLNILPEKRGFARQFERIQSAITQRTVKEEYQLNKFSKLVITDQYGDEMFDEIVSGEEDSGRRYLKIYTVETEAFEAFKPSEKQ